MITVLRRWIKSKTFKAIFWITIAALAGVFSLPELFKWSTGKGNVAKVNGSTISASMYYRTVEAKQEWLGAIRAQYGQFADLILKSSGLSLNPKTLALQQLINETLFNQVAYAVGVQLPSDFLLNNVVLVHQDLMDFLPAQAIDPYGGVNIPMLRRYLQRYGLSVNDFVKEVEHAFGRRLVRTVVAADAYVPDFEVKRQFMLKYIGKNYSIITFDFNTFEKE